MAFSMWLFLKLVVGDFLRVLRLPLFLHRFYTNLAATSSSIVFPISSLSYPFNKCVVIAVAVVLHKTFINVVISEHTHETEIKRHATLPSNPSTKYPQDRHVERVV